MRRLAQIVFFAATAVALVLAAREHGTLPERVASHFGADGQPNGWMSRDGHTMAHIGIILFLVALFVGLTVALPRLPERFVNLPHRDYWLAPKRRGETFAWLGATLLWLGAFLQCFLAYAFYEVWRANLTAPPQLQLKSLWLHQANMFILIVGLVITLLFRFRRPDAEGQKSGR